MDVGKIIRAIMKEDPTQEHYGYLPVMATASKASIGALLASSFCERINSAANIILHDGNLSLSEREINKLVVLRVNRRFMEYMRKTYSHVTQQELKMCKAGPVITEEENKEDV